MKRWIALVLGAVLLLSLFACTTTEDDPVGSSSIAEEVSSSAESELSPYAGNTLTLYTWSLMIPQSVMSDFTEETGILLDYQTFENEEEMLTRLKSEKSGTYDLVICNDASIEQVIAEGLAQKMDPVHIENYKQINSLYQGLSFDPDDEYTVPYGAAVQAIVYDPSIVGEITGWEDLWSSLLKGRLGIVPDSNVAVGMALKAIGQDYQTADEAALKQAEEKLNDLLPNIACVSEMELPEKMASGEIAAAVMYPTQAVATVLANDNLKLVYPKEGTGFGVQEAFLAAGSERTAEAALFLDFLLRPEIGARCFEYLGMMSTNDGADDLLSDAYAPLLSLPKNYIEVEPLQFDSAVQTRVDTIWAEFRAKLEQ